MQFFAERLNWCDNALRAEFFTADGPITCVIPRDTIHHLPAYGDLVGWEIERRKAEIMQRLMPAIRSKIAAGALHCDGTKSFLILVPRDIEAADADRTFQLDSGAA